MLVPCTVPNGVLSGYPPAYGLPPRAVWQVTQLPMAARLAPRSISLVAKARARMSESDCTRAGPPHEADSNSAAPTGRIRASQDMLEPRSHGVSKAEHMTVRR